MGNAMAKAIMSTIAVVGGLALITWVFGWAPPRAGEIAGALAFVALLEAFRAQERD